jgi:hypothetical protein
VNDILPEAWQPYAKAIVAFLVTVLGGAIAQGAIEGAGALWINILVGALGTYGVYQVTNKPAAPPAVPPTTTPEGGESS